MRALLDADSPQEMKRGKSIIASAVKCVKGLGLGHSSAHPYKRLSPLGRSALACLCSETSMPTAPFVFDTPLLPCLFAILALALSFPNHGVSSPILLSCSTLSLSSLVWPYYERKLPSGCVVVSFSCLFPPSYLCGFLNTIL